MTFTFEHNGKEVEFEAKDFRSQGGLKRDIVKLVLAAPTPDRGCELTDFLMCLQAILDKHLEDQRGPDIVAMEEAQMLRQMGEE